MARMSPYIAIGLLCQGLAVVTASKRGETWCEIVYRNTAKKQLEIFPCQTRNLPVPAGNAQKDDCCPAELWNSTVSGGVNSLAWKQLSARHPHMTDFKMMRWNGQKKFSIDKDEMCQHFLPQLIPLMRLPPTPICKGGADCMYFRWFTNNTIITSGVGAFENFIVGEPHPFMTIDAGKPALLAIAPDGTVFMLKTYFTTYGGVATTTGGSVTKGPDPDLCSYAESAAVKNKVNYTIKCGLLKEKMTCGGNLKTCKARVTGDNWLGAYCEADQQGAHSPDVCSLPYEFKRGCSDESSSQTTSTTATTSSTATASSTSKISISSTSSDSVRIDSSGSASLSAHVFFVMVLGYRQRL